MLVPQTSLWLSVVFVGDYSLVSDFFFFALIICDAAGHSNKLKINYSSMEILSMQCVIWCEEFSAVEFCHSHWYRWPSLLGYCFVYLSQHRSVCSNFRGHSGWLSTCQGQCCWPLFYWLQTYSNCLHFSFDSLLQALHTAASSMLLPRNGPCTWAQRTPFLKPMMADLRTSSRISLKSEFVFNLSFFLYYILFCSVS